MLAALPLATIPAEDEALRPAIRAFLARHVPGIPPEIRARSWMGFDAGFSRALAAQGWLGLTFPEDYGGAGRGHFARYVLVEELLAAGAPVSAHWIADRQSGPLILRFGTEAQRRFHLPRICRGESFFCIGMSEPDTGSDLASVSTRAVREGEGWRLNGAKVWTTNAHHSHYMIALARSSGTVQDRQKGLSQFIVDLSLRGIRISPIRDLAGDAHFNEVVFDNVLLPADALVGEEGAGWAQVNAELAFERSGPERVLSSAVLLDTWLAWLRERGASDPATRARIGRLLSHLAVLRAMSVSVTDRLVRGESPVVEAALVKDLGTEFEQAIPALLEDWLGENPAREPPAALLRALAYTSAMAPSYSLRGGTREILRGMIARGMGLR
ncbi:acyl-CoA dehydrogenase family protein [Pseudoroseomonas cervicalis]|uniref:acyl-CoA dehydrogenase family protein n=1 Tax=Teichococcus cervicalis TaxID=204525 RepID=UPI0022F174CF|nr:acyl-CoA dehydrogenase family protein [Pseudoroseomonas cervicalis]WBV41588.1 acyl-CoA dehydrogenase family protein [Pseudoroseomonas cervicalis]